MRHAYRKLSYSEYKRAMLTYLNSFKLESKRRLLLAFEVCDKMEDESEKKYRLEQTVNSVLWDFDEAIEIGFAEWKSFNLVNRNNALIYHDLNKDECDGNCLLCKEAFGWKS
jgi:hypothetical protein|tara:strand:- start:1115 stop:1450 length:336 start_codon:yes stop_codon:yes gene_type:complete